MKGRHQLNRNRGFKSNNNAVNLSKKPGITIDVQFKKSAMKTG